MKQYIPFHSHTTKASMGDSTLKIKAFVKKAKEMGLKALALTNHGSMADMYDFYIECINNGIKPILGCEVYECQDRTHREKRKKTKKDLAEEAKLLEQGIQPIDNETNHLVLIATNPTGIKNLLDICSDAELIGKYYKPRTDLSFLREHGEGIVALTACLGGRIPRYLKDDRKEDAVDFLNQLKSIFDDVYLEIQPGDFEDQIRTNFQLIDLAEETNTKLIATNDIHYLNFEDWEAHDAHVKSNRKLSIDSEMIYPDKCYYLMTREDITNRLLNIGIDETLVENMLDNTEKLADMIVTELDTSIKMPIMELPEGFSARDLVEKLCLDRLDRMKYALADPSSYISQLYHELDVIEELDFCHYFLMVRDLVMYAKNNDIPIGPGRGSVCGSVIAYLLQITAVDPIKYNLLFERFLSVHRKGSIPDVDLDFASHKRHMMFEYSIEKYGEDCCAQVATFSIRKAKAAIRDAAKIHNIDLEIEDAVAKLIPQVYYSESEEGGEEKLTDLSIEQSLHVVKELREYQEIYPEWFKTALDMEGLPKAGSIHAAGTLISSRPLKELVPLVKQDKRDINATSLDLAQAECAGLVKMDYLGLATLYVTNKVEKDTGFKFDMEFGDFEDENVWNLIGSRNTTGLFQISSKIYKDRMGRLQPKTIKELAACLALVRGPCISAKTDQQYIEILEGKKEIELIHPLYDKEVKDTNGIMIYQEQLMRVCTNFGFTLEEGYQIMKASAKKKFDVLKSYEDRFMILAKERDVDKEIAERIFKMIVDSGLYSFNESHAIAYAILCYVTAYYKTYFPTEYMAAELTNVYQNGGKDDEKLKETVNECRRLGLKFSPVDINESDWEFKREAEGVIKIGFCAISSFGDKAAAEVIAKRPFYSIEELIENVEGKVCGKRALVPLMLSGAMGDPTESYKELCALRGEEYDSQVRIHNHLSIDVYAEDFEIEELLFGSAYINSPINSFKQVGYANLNENAIINIQGIISRVTKKKDSKKNDMCFITIETGDGNIDLVVFASVYEHLKKVLKKNVIKTFKVKKQKSDSGVLMQVV